jgi:hypothetical protein
MKTLETYQEIKTSPKISKTFITAIIILQSDAKNSELDVF